MTETIFEQVEKAWSADSDDYDNVIQKQLKNQKDVEHWKHELKTVLGEKPLPSALTGKRMNVLTLSCPEMWYGLFTIPRRLLNGGGHY